MDGVPMLKGSGPGKNPRCSSGPVAKANPLVTAEPADPVDAGELTQVNR